MIFAIWQLSACFYHVSGTVIRTQISSEFLQTQAAGHITVDFSCARSKRDTSWTIGRTWDDLTCRNYRYMILYDGILGGGLKDFISLLDDPI